MMEQKAQTLPKGWIATALSEIAAIEAGNPAPQGEKYFKDGEFPFIRVQDMGQLNGSMVIRETRDQLNAAGIKNLKLFKKGSILFTKSGASTLLNQRAILGCDSYIVSHIGVAVPRAEISSEWLYYFLKIVDFAHYAHGANMPSLPLSKVKEIAAPLAPLNEQKRIVDKIETLFSDLDKGEENLRTAQRLIASYRQSVLKSAVTGELTRDWREANKHRLEPGDKLLRRILQTRREQWKGRGKYEEPSAPNTAPLPKLPDEWVWTSIEQLFNVYVGSTPSRKEAAYWNGNIPWVSSGEVAFCRIKDTKEKITQEGYDNSSVKLHPKGTVLLAMIGEGKTRGQAAILDIEACHNQNAASIRVSETEIPPEYIYYLLLHNYEKNRLVGQGGNQPALNGLKIKKFTVPLPPLEEAREIVSRVEDIFSQIAALEAWCETELTRSATLRQAILKSAFSGQLVPQDASDEPASDLLKRIQAERASTPKAKPAAKRGRLGKRRAA